MPYTAAPYNDTDFDELRDALVRWYPGWDRPDNWLLARIESWRFRGSAWRYHDDPEYWAANAHCFRDETGALAGFVVSEYGNDELFLQVDPARRDVEPVMLDWIDTVWAAGRERIAVFALQDDTTRVALLTERGYTENGCDGNTYRYDLTRAYPDATLPSGFRLTTMEEFGDIAAQAAAVCAAFDTTNVTEGVMKFRRIAPTYHPDWDLVVATDDGQCASFGTLWVDRQNRIAEFEPIGTQPKFQRRGLARALILSGFRRLAAEGIHTVYIGSGPEPAVGNRLYQGLEPVAMYPFIRWAKATG